MQSILLGRLLTTWRESYAVWTISGFSLFSGEGGLQRCRFGLYSVDCFVFLWVLQMGLGIVSRAFTTLVE